MRRAFLSLVVAVLLVTTGCLGAFVSGGSRPPSDQRALNVVNQTQAATNSVSTYRFSINGQMRTDGDNAESYHITGNGASDVREKQLEGTTGLEAPSQSRATYITGNTQYTECSRMGWERENLSKSTRWLNFTPLGQQIALLQQTDVYWQGTKTMNGRKVAVINASPTKHELSTTNASKVNRMGLGNGVNIKNANVTAWVDTKTDRLLRTRYELRLGKSATTATATITTRFTNYNGSVKIQQPFTQRDIWQLGCPNSD